MKENWKPGTLIYPLPAVLVSCGATPDEYNLLTVAWTGTVCTNPPMCYIDPETGKLELQKARPIVYSHGEYFALGRMLGYFGWSVRRKKRIKRERQPDKMKK